MNIKCRVCIPIGHNMNSSPLKIETVDRYEAALELIESAARSALTYFNEQDSLVKESKVAPMDVVSQADREVESALRQQLKAIFPDDSVIGEEGGISPGQSDYTWVIDPIDGTLPFVSGLPHWCIAIALMEAETTVAAVTLAPVSGQHYAAARGAGFWVNHHLQPAITNRPLVGNMTAIGASPWADPSVLGHCIQSVLEAGSLHYRNGSGALMLAEVAAGHLAGYYEPHMMAWDCLGGLLMVEEAGGVIAPIDNKQLMSDGHEVLAATPAAFTPLETIIKSATQTQS